MEIVVTTNRWRSDPQSRDLVDFLEQKSTELEIEDSVLYYDFPAYADYEASIWRPDILLFSPKIGFIAIRNFDTSMFQRTTESVSQIDDALGDFTSNLHSRLVKSRKLRSSRTSTVVNQYSIILFPPNLDVSTLNLNQLESDVCQSFQAVAEFLIQKKKNDRLSTEQVAEVRSVVEGAKGISRANSRAIVDPQKHPLAAMLSKVEQEITNFDQKQRNIALIDVGGPARIRGLAGSGKTIILAMKAAHLHLNNPDKLILFTFLTKSLRSTIKTLITKFFRQYSDEDPNWKKIHIRHGWGGGAVPGVYSEACKRTNFPRLNFPEAQRLSHGMNTPFGFVCEQLMASGQVKPLYDHVLIDEGQDFPASFYQLALAITKGEKDHQSIVWAYDELQDIMNVKIRQPKELFGLDDKGVPLVDLDRSSKHIPPGATNDAVLSRAYRNQRDVLVSAHALGFGIYGEIVQMLESAEHWEDVGYNVLSGPFETNHNVEIFRPDSNSPLNIQSSKEFPLIDFCRKENFVEEVEWVTAQIRQFIDAGLDPSEILVISLDDRSAKSYFQALSQTLATQEISSNNIIADPYNEPPFTITGKVTLSTVYRAKGNEAAVVFAVGIDAIKTKTRSGRNKIFTAFTRTKAWLRVSGTSNRPLPILEEIQTAMEKSPTLEFKMPDLAEIETIQRGFSQKATAAKAARKSYIERLRAAGLSEEEIDEELQREI